MRQDREEEEGRGDWEGGVTRDPQGRDPAGAHDDMTIVKMAEFVREQAEDRPLPFSEETSRDVNGVERWGDEGESRGVCVGDQFDPR